jgi:hypothetical protein
MIFIDIFLVFIGAFLLSSLFFIFERFFDAPSIYMDLKVLGIPLLGIITLIVCAIVVWRRFAKKQDKVWKKFLAMFLPLVAYPIIGMFYRIFFGIAPIVLLVYFVSATAKFELGERVEVLVRLIIILFFLGGILIYLLNPVRIFFLDCIMETNFADRGLDLADFLLGAQPFMLLILCLALLICAFLLYRERRGLDAE